MDQAPRSGEQKRADKEIERRVLSKRGMFNRQA